jgi:hypothetical protein
VSAVAGTIGTRTPNASALRRDIGAKSRAYVEQVHDVDRVAARLVDIYRSL